MKLAADWVITAAAAYRNAWVSVRDGTIEWMGPAGDRGAPAGEVVELGHGVLLPGLVNAHCHLELTHLAGRVDASGGFVRWVERLVDARPRFTDAEVDAGIARGIDEAVADRHRRHRRRLEHAPRGPRRWPHRPCARWCSTS